MWLCFEIVFIYIFFPETYGKTLEELHFCKSASITKNINLDTTSGYGLLEQANEMSVFESEKDERDQLAAAASKVISGPTVVELHEHPDKKA